MVRAYLVTAAVTGGLFVAVAYWLQREGTPRRTGTLGAVLPVPTGGTDGPTPETESPMWPVGFLLLVVATVLLTVLGLGGGQMTILLGFLGAGVVGFLVAGVFVMARSHGHPYSHAVGEAVVTLGAVWLVAVVAWVLLDDGIVF